MSAATKFKFATFSFGRSHDSELKLKAYTQDIKSIKGKTCFVIFLKICINFYGCVRIAVQEEIEIPMDLLMLSNNSRTNQDNSTGAKLRSCVDG